MAVEPITVSNEPKKKIYLDQNVYGHMLTEGGGDWRASAVGRVLEAAHAAGKGLVWLGPTHVVETMLTTEDQRRRDLARTMLEVAGFTRVWHGYELDVVAEFFDFLRCVSPKCIRTTFFLDQALEDQARIWLGSLALLALGAPTAVLQADGVRRLKLQNRLLHARFATDPNGWVDRMCRAATGWQTTREDVFADINAMSLDEITNAITTLRAKAKKLDKKHFDRLNGERTAIAAAYGALDVTAGLDATFVSPMSLDLTLDTSTLVADWPAQQSRMGLRSMPKDVVSAPLEKQAFDSNMRVAIIDTAIQAWASKHPLTATLSYESLLYELQRKLNNKELPTKGVVLDADHAGSLRRVDIFYTEDGLFGEIVGALAESVAKRTEGRHQPVVRTSASGLAALLGVPAP